MRFVIAIVLFVAAVITAGIGVAQRTIWQGPDHLTTAVEIEGDVPFVIVDGTILNSNTGSQLVSAADSETVFMAYGRTSDVVAWVGDAPNALITLDEETGETVVEEVDGTETQNPSPVGSDLWLAEFSSPDSELTRRINVPADVSLLLASDGTAPAPSAVSVTWPLDNSTPWSGPLIVTGIGLLLLGLIVLLWALIHARRKHGPRRKTTKMPKPPKPAQLKPAPRRAALTAPLKGRRRTFTAIPVLLVGALALGGCTADGAIAPAESPDPSAASETPEFEPPVATKSQVERIISRIVETVTAADAAKDEAAASTRLAGPALEARAANYKATTADPAIPAIAAFPAGEVELIVPQQLHVWPRIVFASIAGAENDDYGVMLVQESPRDQYKVHYLLRLTQSIPEMAPADLGAASLAPDNKLLAYTPGQLATQYGDLLINGDASAFAAIFDPENDLVRENLGAAQKEARRAEIGTAVFEFTSQPGTAAPYAMTTLDTGAIVAVDIRESETVRPAETGAAINPKGTVKALSGKTTTTKGFTSVYATQVLFYVPPLTAEGEKVRVLGFAQNIVSATEVP
ncbi:hypothetical protein [Salinibacterium sp. ZJ70]|uniref:hypothetical protein n=1 Tax=Salinibacterium sp. ZJ70 TaxID=2708084 RepID=UPI0014244EE7|nr:hypothetical protein [Salinibacterium sp. ZJ70]